MIDNAERSGLVFDERLVQQCYAPLPFQPLGLTHDHWSLVPWGLPKHRDVPAGSVLSNTAVLRYQQMASYRPAGLAQAIGSYPELEVLSPAEL